MSIDTEESLKANVASFIEVTSDDLPLSCPMPNMSLWNMHPKVYLPIEDKKQASCPYCGTRYVLVEKKVK